MSKQEVHLELLLGARVYTANGETLGRLEDFRVEQEKGRAFLVEYLVGTYALFDRLSSLMILRSLLNALGWRPRKSGYKIPWDKLDLSDVRHPRITCAVDELENI